MAAPTPTEDTLNFTRKIGINDSMIDRTKMIILLAFHDYPQSDYDKAIFIKEKFKEKYGGIWSCGIIKNGEIGAEYFKYFIHVEYGGYRITIWKSSI